jgi:signal transduction histidine kinase/streptogramin lyase
MSSFRLTLRDGLWSVVTGCFLLLRLSTCDAQDLRYLSHQSWSTEDGLPQSSVHDILQTSDGYLWIATEGGLARFDGVTFRIFNRNTEHEFVSDDICCMADDGSRGLWIGTADGLLRMQQGQFRNYGVADGISSPKIVSMAVRGDGSFTVGTSEGSAQWKPPGFQVLSRVSAEQIGDRPRSMPGPGDALWIYSRTAVAVTRNGVRRNWRTGREFPAGRIQTLFVDREGLAWVGMNNGLLILNAADASVTPVASLGGNSVLSVFEDAESNHWIGTETSGLHVLRTLKFRRELALTGKAVTSVVQSRDGAIWIGTRDDGLRRVRNGIVDQPVAEPSLTSSVILCLAPGAHGGLWVGTPDGLNYIAETNSVQRITSANGLPDDYIRSLVADPDGSVWIGTQHGLAHLRGSTVQTLTSADGLGGDTIGAMLLTAERGSSTPNELWIGTSGKLSRIRGNGQIDTFTTKDGLGGQIATAMAQDRAGDLWVATKDGGLSLFDGQRFLSVATFPHDRSVVGISADGLGFLWFRMDRGIRRMAVAALHACATSGGCPIGDVSVTNYGLADGLPNDEVVTSGSSMAWLATNGEIWFPTRSGVAIADTEHLPSNMVPPPIVLQRFLVDDASEELGTAPIDIPFGHARFTMEYAGLSYTAPSEVRYRFQLEGFDKNWIDAGGRRSVSYTNLTSGSYDFRVEALNNDGVWSRTGADLRFHIIPPLYRRWWFIALVVLALIAMLAWLYLLRLRRLRLRFDAVLAERNRMAREIHDTLTQDFIATSLHLDIISQQLARGNVEVAIDQVRRTRQLVTDGLEEARQSIWELRANNSQDSLPTRLTRIVQQDRFATISPRLHVGGAYRPVDSRVERELLRIAQEALSNVMRHAQATEVSIDMHYSNDMLVLIIKDNGVGCSVDEVSPKAEHYGLLGMEERASMIDGILEFSSEHGQGTLVTLRVPIVLSAR